MSLIVTVRVSHASSVVIDEETSMMDSVDVFDDDDIATEQQKLRKLKILKLRSAAVIEQ